MDPPINGYCRNDHPQCQWPMEASERRGRRVRCNISCNMPSVFFFVVGCSHFFASFSIVNLQPSNTRRRQRTVRRQRTADRIVETCNVTVFFLCSLSLVFSHCESCLLRCATARATGVGDAHPMPLACRPGGAVGDRSSLRPALPGTRQRPRRRHLPHAEPSSCCHPPSPPRRLPPPRPAGLKPPRMRRYARPWRSQDRGRQQ